MEADADFEWSVMSCRIGGSGARPACSGAAKDQGRPCSLRTGGAENVEQAWRQHRITVSAAFAVLDVDQHPRAVDRGDLQARNLADPQTRRIGRLQRDTA